MLLEEEKNLVIRKTLKRNVNISRKFKQTPLQKCLTFFLMRWQKNFSVSIFYLMFLFSYILKYFQDGIRFYPTFKITLFYSVLLPFMCNLIWNPTIEWSLYPLLPSHFSLNSRGVFREVRAPPYWMQNDTKLSLVNKKNVSKR